MLRFKAGDVITIKRAKKYDFDLAALDKKFIGATAEILKVSKYEMDYFVKVLNKEKNYCWLLDSECEEFDDGSF